MTRTLRKLPWYLLLLFPLFEVAAHALTRARVAPLPEWQAAAAYVRRAFEPRDAVIAAPDWADPRLREVLGDRIDLALAGRSDLAAYERLWVLSIRGHTPREAPARAPELDRSFGGVRVRRWTLGPSNLVYDFTRRVREAEVSLGERSCPFRRFPPPRGGGLGRGVLYPVERFACDPRRDWLWVAPVVMEDLRLQPRHCVWQHPAGDTPLRVRFEDVPLGDRVVFYGGLYYEHERMREGGPVLARVLVEGEERGRMVHRDGDGWARLVVPTGVERGDLTVEVTAPRPRLRSFCWSATARTGPERMP